MVACKHLGFKSIVPEGKKRKKAFWWCKKHNDYASPFDCTVLPCNPTKSLGGCEDVELSEWSKRVVEGVKTEGCTSILESISEG